MQTVKKITRVLGIAVLAISNTCQPRDYVRLDVDATRQSLQEDRPCITVWIHGVSLFLPNKRDIGLKLFSQITGNKNLAKIGKMLNEYAPARFPTEHTYAYSWAGRFNYEECKRSAQELYWKLKKLVNEYKVAYGQQPKLRVITFSYGGNVAFYLGEVEDPAKLHIDELLLLGYPVAKNISDFAHDPMFKRIFNLYAVMDTVQLIDPQGFVCPFPSCPLFTTRRLNGGANMIQAKTRVNGHSFGHFGFIGRKFVSSIAHVLDGLNEVADIYLSCHKRNTFQQCILNVYTDENMARRHMRK